MERESRFTNSAAEIEAHREETRERISSQVIENLHSEMRNLHGYEEFHNERHSMEAEREACVILDIFDKYLNVSPETRVAARTAAAGHDLVLNYTVVNGRRVRHRGFGNAMPSEVKAIPEVVSRDGRKIGNEELSWLAIETKAKKEDPDGIVYTDHTLRMIEEAVGATYPEVLRASLDKNQTIVKDLKSGKEVDLAVFLDKDNEGRPVALKFIQPLLTKDSGLATFALATGDLKYGGRSSFEDYKKQGNAEFRELHEEISREVKKVPLHLSSERKAEIARTAIEWVRMQIGFLLWQKEDFKDKVESFSLIGESVDPNALKRELYEEYSRFDDNLILSAKRYDTVLSVFGALINPEIFENDSEESERLLDDLLKEMGYLPYSSLITQ